MVNYNLNEHFNKSGHFSKLLVGKKKTDNKDVIEIPNEVRESFCIKLAKSKKTKGITATKPKTPRLFRLTAHGYKKIISTSKTIKRIATKKNCIEKRPLALVSGIIPHS